MYELRTEDLCSGLFSDVMDKMGYKKQVAVDFKRNQKIIQIMGRARTILIETKETNDENIRGGLSFIGTLRPHDVLIVQGSNEFAYFGELMTKMSTSMQIDGVVIDGLTRDTVYTHREDVHLPIFAKGYSPVDIKGRGCVKETDVSIEIDGIIVKPQDLIFADNDGICVIPHDIEKDVLRNVRDKLADEQRITKLLNEKISLNELLEQVDEF